MWYAYSVRAIRAGLVVIAQYHPEMEQTLLDPRLQQAETMVSFNKATVN